MISGTAASVAKLFASTCVGVDAHWHGVSTDTRTLRAGQLFVALNGPNFHGTDFIAEARERGAAAAVVDRVVEDSLTQIPVSDTRAALGRLGANWRDRFELTVIGVTGSNGKTTVKQMLAACLGPHALATRGNLNNDIGVPLMLAELDSTHEFAVFEMGANHAGEIAYLASLVRPDIAIVTNAAPSHLEGFGTLEGVALAKGELFAALGEGCTAVINRDDAYYGLWAELARPARILSFGSSNDADCYPRAIDAKADCTDFELCLAAGVYRVHLPLPGVHNVLNACAAAVAAVSAGVDAELAAARLASTRPADGRLNVLQGPLGVTVIDDTYNANPASMRASARFAVGLTKPVWMAIGDMGELGPQAAKLHGELGEELRRIGVSRLYATGNLARASVAGFGPNARHFKSRTELAAALINELSGAETILVKGSRAAGMDAVVERLIEAVGTGS